MSLAISSGSGVIYWPGIGHWMNQRYFLGGWFWATTVTGRDVLAVSGNSANNQNVDAISIPFSGFFELDIKRADAYPLGAFTGTTSLSNSTDYFVALQRLNPWYIRLWMGTLTRPPWIEVEWIATGTNGIYDRTVSSSANAVVLNGWAAGESGGTARWQNWTMYAGKHYCRNFTRTDVRRIWSQLAPPFYRPYSWHPALDGTGIDASGNGRNVTFGTYTAGANVRVPFGRRYRRNLATGLASQLLYPSADVTDGSWLNESGNNTNLYASVDEASSPNDSDYIRSSSAPSSDAVTLAFPTSGTPASGSGILRIRHRRV